MHPSTLIDILVTLGLIQLTFAGLLKWLYHGSHFGAILGIFSVLLYGGVFLYLRRNAD